MLLESQIPHPPRFAPYCDMEALIDLILHLDEHLRGFVDLYGAWVYALLFLIIFCETGLVVTPFLPGDSLLFATGALSASGILNIWAVLLLLVAAAILGDAVNYSIGHYLGPKIFTAEDKSGFWHRMLNREHLNKAHKFFVKYGGKAIVLARFVPIVRTFVPFVAGAGSMPYANFVIFNVAGGVLWVGLCTGAGYAFGNMPWVKNNFTAVVIGIVIISLLPILWGYLIGRLAREEFSKPE
jgi:membrane-associated protein